MARQRGNSWQGSLKTPEKYYRYSFPTSALAVEWERRAREAHKAGLPVPTPTHVETLRPTLRSFFETHKEVIWAERMGRNVESNHRAVEHLLGADTLIAEIDEPTVTRMAAEMRRKGHVGSTINTRLSHLKVLLRYAKSLGLTDASFDMPWAKKGDNSRLRFLTEREESALLDLVEHWGLEDHRRVLEALIDTGCRPSELLLTIGSKTDPVRWSEVSTLAGGEAPNVNDPATGGAKAVVSLMRTKTGRYRVLPLTARAQNAFLISAQRGDKRPFGTLTVEELSSTVRRAADHLGLDNVVLYTMRHTCASRLVQRGADLRRVMQWMGHTNINTTLRYAKLTPTDIFALETLL